MSILPSFVQKKQADTTSLKVPAEYGIDFETGQLTGKKVYGLEAIKVWIWLCLQTERYRYQIYSQNYGVSLEQYIGQSPTEDLRMQEKCFRLWKKSISMTENTKY